jgi:single-stranded DNA-binding protein
MSKAHHENQVKVLGNVGSHHHNFQYRKTTVGPVLNITICTEAENRKIWVPVVFYGELAEEASRNLKQGMLIRVKGLVTFPLRDKLVEINGIQATIRIPEFRLEAQSITYSETYYQSIATSYQPQQARLVNQNQGVVDGRTKTMAVTRQPKPHPPNPDNIFDDPERTWEYHDF